MNFKLKNKYYLKIPHIFLDKFGIDLNNLEESVKNYILNNFTKYKNSYDINGNKIDEILGIEI
ncbi:MAG: hypothetical protein Q9M94_01405 [Candidatus Gracilibacteria bacterium]|nr:hypothetical protein [Candidatus Gracilibacteria bacterium]MDQ7022538.1 hypothetical protein [Candidatus Gracilibacteria bacterium]